MSDTVMGVVGDIANVVMGQSPEGASCNREGHGVPLLNGPSEFGQAHPTPVQWTAQPVRLAEPGDVLFCVRGSTTGRMNTADQQYAIGRGLAAIRGCDAGESAFVRYALIAGLPDLLAGVTGSVFPNLSRAQIATHPIPVPSVQVREAIAEVLGALDDTIAANTGFMRTTENLLAARFAALHLDEDAVPHEDTIRLDDLIELNPKVPAPRESEPVYVDMQKLPVAGMSIAQWTRRPAKGGTRFQNGDTLLARITPCLENRKTAYVDFLDEGQVAIGSTEYIVMRSRPGVPSGLTFVLAISDRFRSFAIRHMVGSSGRQRLSAGDLRDYRLRATDKAALESFGRSSDPLLALVRSRTAESRTLRAIRDALLPQLMSGKIRVKDSEQTVGNVV